MPLPGQHPPPRMDSRLTTPLIPVLIASQSPAYASGLAGFLATPPLMPVVSHTVDEALRLSALQPPALAIIEWKLADAPGMELAVELRSRFPATRLSFGVEDESQAAEVLALTGCGSVLRTWTQEALREAVAEALRGFGQFDSSVGGSLNELVRRTSPRQILLTEQERVVLRLMRQQLTYKEIAMRLGVSWHTVRTHAQSILRKLGIHSRRDLESWDVRLGSAAEQPQLLMAAAR